jgi:hypothetical protein
MQFCFAEALKDSNILMMSVDPGTPASWSAQRGGQVAGSEYGALAPPKYSTYSLFG